jgi:hypothetical protein
MTHADESELSFDGDEPWADGGNAEIFAVRWQRRQYFYKRYLPYLRTAVAEHALDRMLAWRTGLPSADQQRLDRCCAWPLVIIRAGDELRGVLVQPAPDAFMTWSGTRRKARSLSGLRLFTEDVSEEEADAYVPEVLAALGHTAQVIRWLHGHDVIVNDVQPENVLVDDEATRIFLVDCDSMVSRHWGGAVAPPTAPDYINGVVTDDPSPSVDLAKLAWCTFLLLLRDFAPRGVDDWVAGTMRRYLTGSTVTLLTEAIDNRVSAPRWDTFWNERAEHWITLGRSGVLVTDAGMRQVTTTVPQQRTEPTAEPRTAPLNAPTAGRAEAPRPRREPVAPPPGHPSWALVVAGAILLLIVIGVLIFITNGGTA